LRPARPRPARPVPPDRPGPLPQRADLLHPGVAEASAATLRLLAARSGLPGAGEGRVDQPARRVLLVAAPPVQGLSASRRADLDAPRAPALPRAGLAAAVPGGGADQHRPGAVAPAAPGAADRHARGGAPAATAGRAGGGRPALRYPVD